MSNTKTMANNVSPSQGGKNTKMVVHTNQEKASLAEKSKERGFWSASFTQRGADQLKEQTLKEKLPTGAFDPRKIDDMMEPKQTYEQLLMIKHMKGEHLTKKEQIIVENIIRKEKELVAYDIEKIEKQGLNARPETNEGRYRLLCRYARFYLDEDKDNSVYYTWMKLNTISVSSELLADFADLRAEMKETIDTLDTIKLQCTDFHHNMPPLNEKGFVRLDDWQKQVIQNIRNERSTIVKAPTSAGKTIIMSYLFAHYAKTITAIYVVPTDILAWQVASMIGKAIDKDIPIATSNYESDIDLEGMLGKIRSVGILVGTPKTILDYLPFINFQIKWLIIDEIHMIGSQESKEMETIIKALYDAKIFALSATIGNITLLRDWFVKVGHDVEVIECNKRFFNHQRFYYDNRKMVRIHPLSLISITDIETGNIKNINLMPTPPDIYDLSQKMKKIIPVSLQINKHFHRDHVITLDEINDYFNILIDWLIANISTHREKIISIISSYKFDDLEENKYDLYDVAVTLRDNDKIPALAFQTNAHECLELVRVFSRRIQDEEEKTFPNLRKERMKQMARADAAKKKIEQIKMDDMGDKKMSKEMMKGNCDTLSEIICIEALNEPHPKFIINNHQPFTQQQMDEWCRELKQYFPPNGSQNHYILDLLWRGVGVYCHGLPEPYLHLVQNLACSGKLGFVFSDGSLVYGVSMPFRTVVIMRDDNLVWQNTAGEIQVDGMTYLQEVGRAGRRGLDKEGNIIHVGYSSKEIKALLTCSIPHIAGKNTIVYGANYGKLLSGGDDRWDRIKSNFLLEKITDAYAKKFYESIDKNMTKGWKFAVNSNSHFLHMMWRFRHSEKGFRAAFLLNEMRKIYKHANPKNENTQIELCKMICYYVDAEKLASEYILTEVDSVTTPLRDNFKTLGLDLPDKIDGAIYLCFQQNRLISMPTDKETSMLRVKMFNFGSTVRYIQNYFYHSGEVILTQLLAKILTRIWWIHHMSSPVMVPINRYIED